jgi:hypothetical protein
MLPFGVTIPVTVPQGSEIPEEIMNNPVHPEIKNALHRGSNPALLGKSFPKFRKKYAPPSSRFGQFIL